MSNWILYLIIGFLLLDLLIVLVIFVKRSRQKGFQPEELQYIRSHWIRIIDMFPSDPKHSILDADKLLDYALSRKGFSGTMAEKLKRSGPRFSYLNNVWTAHKLRNRIAHELAEIDKNEAKSALKYFKEALNDLGAGL